VRKINPLFCLGRLGSDGRWIESFQPLCDQSRFAEAGRSGDEGKLAARNQALVQPLDQAGTRYQVGAGRWDIEFSGQEGCGHFTLLDSHCVAHLPVNEPIQMR
jgi:hypothetical protein